MRSGEAPRLPRWCSISFSSQPDAFYASGIGADAPDEAVATIVDYIRRAGDGPVSVNEAQIRVRPPGGDAAPATRIVEYLDLDRVWPLTDDRIASLAALLRANRREPNIDIRVTFERD